MVKMKIRMTKRHVLDLIVYLQKNYNLYRAEFGLTSKYLPKIDLYHSSNDDWCIRIVPLTFCTYLYTELPSYINKETFERNINTKQFKNIASFYYPRPI